MKLNAIRTVGLTRDYGRLRALDHLDLDIREGELFGLLGPNGAGKTTTIRLLTGLIRPTAGKAYVGEVDVAADPLAAKSRLGVVPERSNLYQELSARDNLVFVAQLYGLPRREWGARADELLREFKLSDRAGTRFGALSGGMKRRLTIAAALVHRPPILLLDEPTTALDVASTRALRGMIRELHQQGATILLTTHLIAEAEQLCDRVGILVQGRLVAVDTPSALCARCATQQVVEVSLRAPSEALVAALRASPQVQQLSRSGNRLRLEVRSVAGALAEIAATAQRFATEIERLQTIGPTLEDAFVALTGVDVETLQNAKPRQIGGGG